MLAQTFIGIDISKAVLDVFDETSSQTLRIANTCTAITAFLLTVADRRTTVVFEATGSYDRALRHALDDAGISYVRVNPSRARDFARASGRLAKTDAIDARMLAAMGRMMAPPCAAPVDRERERLATLNRHRDSLIETRANEKKRLLQSDDAQVRASIGRHLAWLTNEIKALDAAMAGLLAAAPDLAAALALLQTAPGVGTVTAVTLLAQMPELGSRSPKTIAALAGLAPMNNDSGDRRGRRSIKGGRRRVRRALYMAALSAIRAVPRFADAYRAISGRAASKKVAIIAVARKLLVALNAMIANNQPFRA